MIGGTSLAVTLFSRSCPTAEPPSATNAIITRVSCKTVVNIFICLSLPRAESSGIHDDTMSLKPSQVTITSACQFRGLRSTIMSNFNRIRVGGSMAIGSSNPRKFDVHTHYYPPSYFEKIREMPSEFSFDRSPSGQKIITYRGARFFGVTPPMTDVARRLEDMDRVGIEVEVVSLSTPNVFFAEAKHQAEIARMVNDAYADLRANHPTRFKAFASIPMDSPNEALTELHRAIDELKMNGVILLSNIGGNALTSPKYRSFFEEADRLKLCILLHPMLPSHTEPFREYVLGPIIGFMFDTTLAVARMCFDGMFRDFPDIRWIVAHLGGAIPYLMERMDNGWRGFVEGRAENDELPSAYLQQLHYHTLELKS